MSLGPGCPSGRWRYLVFACVVIDLLSRSAEATEPNRTLIDRVVTRFYLPEIGGASRPHFVLERVLAFEARMEAMADQTEGQGEGYGPTHLRAALEHHVSEEVLADLADKLIAGAPPAERPTSANLNAIEEQLSLALFDKLGGQARVRAAAEAEQLGGAELEGLLRRQALAAWYIDRGITPILAPREDQLREIFRTATHPFRGQSYERVRDALARWFVLERVRAAETGFLQGARSRLRIMPSV